MGNRDLLQQGSIGSRRLSLLELILMAAILLTLVSMVVPAFLKYKNREKIALSIADIVLLEEEIQAHRDKHGQPPLSLADIGRDNLLDPWGLPYQYLNSVSLKGRAEEVRRQNRFGVPLNSEYDLYSMGGDGKTALSLAAAASRDDIVRINDGAFIGLASEY